MNLMLFALIPEIQKTAAKPIRGGQDVLVQSQTGSGKTLAFVMPLLARLQYPPALYPEDLKVGILSRIDGIEMLVPLLGIWYVPCHMVDSVLQVHDESHIPKQHANSGPCGLEA